MTNRLFYGDNLAVLRDSIPDESVDLIYLDPPFNSNANYNVLFKAPSGQQSDAQIEAFEDTWHWTTDGSERAFDEVMGGPNTDAALMLRAMRNALGDNDMMAYLAMMAVRLIELHRALKSTGSLYLHCDTTASHYLKILLDAVFGPDNLRNEVSWRRTNAKADYKQGSKHFPRVRDIILRYSKGSDCVFHQPFSAYSEGYVVGKYRHADEDGRKYRLGDLTAAKPGGETRYAWRVKKNGAGEWEADLDDEYKAPRDGWAYSSVTPYDGRIWVYNLERMKEVARDGRVRHTRTGMPEYKRYLDEMPGVPIGDDWDDIPPLNSQAQERLGYPTQKPVALLERIVAASSNPGDTVLDPFCGCGTTIHAAEKLGRRWIGIDITHLAIGLIERRLKEAFPDLRYEVQGVPVDLDSARDLAARDKHEFQKWITATIGAQPYKGGRKGMDRGIDGYLHFRDADNKPQFAVVSVKGGGTKSGDVRDLKGVMEREQAAMGLFLTLNAPTREMEREAASAGFYETGDRVDPLTGARTGSLFKAPRLQILTAADILTGQRPNVPFSFTEGYKAAKRETGTRQGTLF